MTFIQILLHFRQKTKLTFLGVGRKKKDALSVISTEKRKKKEKESERRRNILTKKSRFQIARHNDRNGK